MSFLHTEHHRADLDSGSDRAGNIEDVADANVSAAWPGRHRRGPPLIFVVEGPNDVHFLRRISRLIHDRDPALPNLQALERSSDLVFLPVGGNGPADWLQHLDSLGRSRLYLFDREVPPESASRWNAVQRLNRGRNQRGFITGKRTLENYLHPQAVANVLGFPVSFSDHDSVAEVVASSQLLHKQPQFAWSSLSVRTRKRHKDRAKRWLNTIAVEQMTYEQYLERDPIGEIRSWLMAVAELLDLHT